MWHTKPGRVARYQRRPIPLIGMFSMLAGHWRCNGSRPRMSHRFLGVSRGVKPVISGTSSVPEGCLCGLRRYSTQTSQSRSDASVAKVNCPIMRQMPVSRPDGSGWPGWAPGLASGSTRSAGGAGTRRRQTNSASGSNLGTGRYDAKGRCDGRNAHCR